jgi:MFS family permease
VVLALIVLAVFGALGLGRHGYTSVLPAMQDSLKLTNTQTGELQSWNLVGYLLTVVFAGVLAARFGSRLVISISLLITAAALALTGVIPTFDGARMGRFLAGVGGAGSNVPAMALVSAWFGVRRRGLAAGAAVGGSSLGLMVTGPLIPVLLERYGAEGWRVSWYVLGGMAAGVFILCALFLRDRPEDHGLVPLGETSAEARQRADGKRASSLQWALVYRSQLLWHLAAIYFAFGFSYVIYSTFFIRYLVKEADFTQPAAGLLWLQVGLVSVISGFIWGSVSDRWGRRLALLWVFGLQGLAFVIFGLSREWPAVYLSAGLFAMTAWSIPALMAALCGDIFGGRLAPAALGLMTIVFGIGQALGPYLAGQIADTTQSFSLAFVIAGLVALILGGGGSLLLRPSTRIS